MSFRLAVIFLPLSYLCQVLIILKEQLITVLNMNFKNAVHAHSGRVKLSGILLTWHCPHL